MSTFSQWFRKQRRRMGGDKYMTTGPLSEANSGWVDPKPYVIHYDAPYAEYYNKGLFEGYNGDLWMYFAFPKDVKIEWVRDSMEPVLNQHFFVDVVNDLGSLIDDQTDRSRNDYRTKFHIRLNREVVPNIIPPAGSTPAYEDYIRRMSDSFTRPRWYGYMGVRLYSSNPDFGAYGMEDKVKSWMEYWKGADVADFKLFERNYTDTVKIMADHGFRTLDFIKNPEELTRLTAWHGVKDDERGMTQDLEHIRSQAPVHGRSVITPRWGELAAHALVPAPDRDIFMVDPASEQAPRWGVSAMDISNNTVCINIRGEIRSPRVMASMFDDKAQSPRAAGKMNRIQVSKQMAEQGHAGLDNVEIILLSQVIPGKSLTDGLKNVMGRRHGLRPRHLVGRHPEALASTLPAYPKSIARVPRGNRSRSPIVNEMYAGVLAMSGIFRSTKAAAAGHMLMGLSDDQEFKEIYTSLDGAARSSGTPGCLFTGRPGSGKTQQILQLIAQVCYMERKAFFINPKKDQTLKPFFDLLDGLTINMSAQFLKDTPGALDAMFYYDNRSAAATVISDNIIRASRLSEERGSSVARTIARVRADINERANDPRNRTTYDVIFGNEEVGTTPISNEDIRELVADKIKESPFWIAFVARDADASRDIVNAIRGPQPILVEWDSSMNLPSADAVKAGTIDDRELDSILSVTTTFIYAAELLGSSDGGLLAIDEAWSLKPSPHAMGILETAGREWRSKDIMLLLATQKIADFFDGTISNDLRAFFSRMLFMAISHRDEADMKLFFELTGLPDNATNRAYMKNAGVKPEYDEDGNVLSESKDIPNAYWVDDIYDYSGGLICGPWPKRELNAGRTDKRDDDGEMDGLEVLDGIADDEIMDMVSANFGSGSFAKSLISDNRLQSIMDRADDLDRTEGGSFLG